MSIDQSATLYLRLYKKKHIHPGKDIFLGDIAQMIVDESFRTPLQALLIAKASEHEGTHQLIDIMKIVFMINRQFPDLQIEHFGDPHIMIELTTPTRKPLIWWMAVVWVLLFVGSGLAIMNFHEDVSMLEVHQRVYELLTGTKDDTPRMIQIPYSIGIGLGMVIFFNHIFKKKLNEEPSPLEVEMFTYQESIHQYIVAEEYTKKHQGTETK
jgi:stage V sporulation protein AA